MDEAYIGDGIYVVYDYGQYRLRAPRGVDDDHIVYLEPEVLKAFDEYRRAVEECITRQKQGASL